MMDMDRTDSSTTQESFYLRPGSPASRQERSFFSSTPRADSNAGQRLSQQAPPSPLTSRKAQDHTETLNGIDKAPTLPVPARGQLNSDSSYSIDVLSGGESECESLRKRRDDTLGRLLRTPASSNGVINSVAEYANIGTGTGTFDGKHGRRGHGDRQLYIAKELLMTERTYKKDLEVITVWLREELPLELELELCGSPLWAPLEGIRALQDPALRALEARLLGRPDNNNREGAPEPLRTGGLMLAYLKDVMPLYLTWVSSHRDSLQRLEQACSVSPTLEQVCREVEQQQRACYLPITTFLLKPLYRLLHYQQLLTRAISVSSNDEEEYDDLKECLNILQPVCNVIEDDLPDSLNYSHLCLLHRDIDGFDNLVLPGRQFIRQGCLFKHSNKGPQQRMFFLFSDILVYGSKCSSSQQQFRVHGVIPLSSVQVEPAEYINSFTLYGGGRAMTLSASNPAERDHWLTELDMAAEEARSSPHETPPLSRSISTSVSAEELSDGGDTVSSALQRSNTLSHVCWHRNTSLSWRHLFSAMENQLSGNLLRKFKNSLGWQKLWVVFASFCLYFYKTCHDDYPLASLPLLGYVVTTPSERDGINKDYVFKLVFKNHIYFFRAESEYTFKRWMEVIGSATTQPPLEE